MMLIWTKRAGAAMALIGLVLALASLMPILSPAVASESPDFTPMIWSGILVALGVGLVVFASVAANVLHDDKEI